MDKLEDLSIAISTAFIPVGNDNPTICTAADW